jgi:gas vesicle protein
MKTKHSLVLALSALAAGAALGVLFAPDSGKCTRRRIKRKTEDMHDRLNAVIDEGKDLLEDLRHDADRSVQDIKDKIRNVKSSVTTDRSGGDR